MRPAAPCRSPTRSRGCFRRALRPRSCSTRSRPISCIGWPRANRPAEREFLLPDIGSTAGDRPHHRTRQHRQSRSRAGAQARSHPRCRLDQPDLCVAGRARAGADRHSLCAARRPLCRDRDLLSQARRVDRPPRRGRGPRRLHQPHARHHHAAHRRCRAGASGRAFIMRAARAGWKPGSAARSMSRPSNCWRAMSRASGRAGSPMCRSSRCCSGIPT